MLCIILVKVKRCFLFNRD